MSNVRDAFVETIYVSEPREGARGTYQTYNAKLRDKDSGEVDENWYQFGFEMPTFKGKELAVGDYVRVMWEPAPKGTGRRVKDFKVSQKPPADTNKPPAGVPSNKASTVKESEIFGTIGGYNTEDDIARITRSTALNAAVQVIGKLLDHKALKISEAQGAAGTAKRYEQVMVAIDKLATKYFHDLATGRQLEIHDDSEIGVTDTEERVLNLPTEIPTEEDFDDDFS